MVCSSLKLQQDINENDGFECASSSMSELCDMGKLGFCLVNPQAQGCQKDGKLKIILLCYRAVVCLEILD